MKKIPAILIYSRLAMGMLIIILSLQKANNYRIVIISLIIAGLLSDIFDGIIARQLKVSTEKLRRLDSGVDMIFWLAVLTGCYIVCPDFFKSNSFKISIVLALEIATYAISFIRFKKEVATHALLSKLWTLSIFATLIQIIASCQSVILFNVCVWLGVISRLEIVAMLLIIKKWTNDIPTVYHAVLMRKGKPIKRMKLFNG